MDKKKHSKVDERDAIIEKFHTQYLATRDKPHDPYFSTCREIERYVNLSIYELADLIERGLRRWTAIDFDYKWRGFFRRLGSRMFNRPYELLPLIDLPVYAPIKHFRRTTIAMAYICETLCENDWLCRRHEYFLKLDAQERLVQLSELLAYSQVRSRAVSGTMLAVMVHKLGLENFCDCEQVVS